MMTTIEITPVANGFIVRAGCLTLVVENPIYLRDEVSRWLVDPRKVEDEYTKRYIAAGSATQPPGTPYAPYPR